MEFEKTQVGPQNDEEFDSERSDKSESLKDSPSEPVEQKDNIFGENYEVLDVLSPNDEIWKNKEFKRRLIGTLGPDVFQRPQLAAKVEPFVFRSVIIDDASPRQESDDERKFETAVKFCYLKKLEWAYGFNRDANVINLCYGNKQRIIFFNITQCGAVYNFRQNNMQFLQGHPNKVVSVSSVYDGKFIATADSGPDNVIIVWQKSDMTPAMIYFDPFEGHNILCIALSPTGNFLIAVGESGEDDIRIDFRMWAKGKEVPEGTSFLKNNYGNVIQIKFSMNKDFHFAVLFERAVAFLQWDPTANKLSDPVVPTIKSKGKFGNLTGMTYIEECHEVMVSTCDGCVIFFGSTTYYREFVSDEIDDQMIAVKICKIAKVSVNSIDSADGVVITGDDEGVINVFDKRLRLLFWFHEYLDKPVYTVRFNMIPRRFTMVETRMDKQDYISRESSDEPIFQDDSSKLELIYKDRLRSDASLARTKWVIRNFIVVQNETVTFVDFVKNIHTVIYERGRDKVGAIAVHHEFTYLVIAYKNGSLCLFEYENSDLRVLHTLPPAQDLEENPAEVTCLEYSDRSLYLACGRSNGEMWILHPVLMTPTQEVINVSSYSIERITFSNNNQQLAFCNNRTTVYLMILDKGKWIFIGKVRPHYKDICHMFFFPTDPRTLVTMGLDRNMVMYNNIDIEPGIELRSILKVRIDQTAVPLACEVYPSKHSRSIYRYMIIADDQHKYKLLNEDTQMCRFVALGPSYGCYQDTPVTKIKILPDRNDDYMVFMTKKHFGLQKLPVTGNPYSFVGCYGHHDDVNWRYLCKQNMSEIVSQRSRNLVLLAQNNFSPADVSQKLRSNDSMKPEEIFSNRREINVTSLQLDTAVPVQIEEKSAQLEFQSTCPLIIVPPKNYIYPSSIHEKDLPIIVDALIEEHGDNHKKDTEDSVNNANEIYITSDCSDIENDKTFDVSPSSSDYQDNLADDIIIPLTITKEVRLTPSASKYIELVDFKVSGDGEYVFTFGKDDTTVLKWKTQIRGVELMHNLGGQDFEPFYCVIEGGKNGFLFQEMQDLFFYMQVLHEGENSTLPRRVTDKLAVSELPDLMRACGYYPTDFEIETFMVDVKYRDFDNDGSVREVISFLDFVKLYVNHKPVYGYSLATLRSTFDSFTECVAFSSGGSLQREEFIQIVTEEGEPFTLSQINQCMEILLGAHGATEGGHFLFDFIPQEIDFDIFMDDILGIDMDRVEMGVQDSKTESESSNSSVN